MDIGRWPAWVGRINETKKDFILHYYERWQDQIHDLNDQLKVDLTTRSSAQGISGI